MDDTIIRHWAMMILVKFLVKCYLVWDALTSAEFKVHPTVCEGPRVPIVVVRCVAAFVLYAVDCFAEGLHPPFSHHHSILSFDSDSHVLSFQWLLACKHK